MHIAHVFKYFNISRFDKLIIPVGIVLMIHIITFFFFSLKWKNGKPKPNEAYCPTEIEHLANIVTHGIAILPCILGTYELCWRSESFMQLFAALIYGATLVFLFSISTCFHCVFFRNQNGYSTETTSVMRYQIGD